MSTPVYRRVLLKISGESLQGAKGHGYDSEAVAAVVARVKEALDSGVEIALVVGAGNIWRGLAGSKGGMDRVTADQMGMLATAMNALCLKNAFTAAGVDCVLHSAIAMEPFVTRYNRDEALRQLSEHKLVIFACGTGSPYFTTDTTAALRGNQSQRRLYRRSEKRSVRNPFRDNLVFRGSLAQTRRDGCRRILALFRKRTPHRGVRLR